MLQQTQAATAGPFFERFVADFPGVRELAAAGEDDVMARWAGLGYYSRARNLMACAREVVAVYGGELPADPRALRALPGFGPYTTAAVASLAFGRPLAVLDGNVARVLSRLAARGGDARRPAARVGLQELANDLLERDAPGDWNEALMELGATLCRPRTPRCGECPLAPDCRARASGRQEEFPARAVRNASPVRPTVVLLVADAAGRLLCRRRGDDGMLRGLWELPCLEAAAQVPPVEGDLEPVWRPLAADLRGRLAEATGPLEPAGAELRFRSTYSHFQARVLALRFRATAPGPGTPPGCRWLEAGERAALGFSARDRRVLAELWEGGRE